MLSAAMSTDDRLTQTTRGTGDGGGGSRGPDARPANLLRSHREQN